jgi:hypothetical protein
MKIRLPQNLSPQAKRVAAKPSSEPVACLVQLNTSMTNEGLTSALSRFGATIRSFEPETHQAVIETTAEHLTDLAKLKAITYVQIDGRYRI